MTDRCYPFDLEFVKGIGAALEPISVPFCDDRYILGIGLTSRCNFNCPICYYHGPAHKNWGSDMTLDLVEKILKYLPRLARIVVGLEGEPLLHENFTDALQIMTHHAKEILIITNGSLLNAELSRKLLRFPITYTMFSIDAASENGYAKFRSGGNLAQFMRNVTEFVSLGHKAILHATVFKENLDSLLGLPRLARNLGISCISLQQLRNHAGSLKRGIHTANQQELEHWFSKFMAEAHLNQIQIMPDKFFGGPSYYNDLCNMADGDQLLIAEKTQHRKCPHVENFAAILANGNLFPCAGDFIPATLQEYSFDTIFNNPYQQILRRLHRNRIISKPCSICMNIQEKN